MEVGQEARATGAKAEPGSFRDFDSRVLLSGDRILRALSPAGLEDFEALERSDLFAEGQSSGAIVNTGRAAGVELPPGAEPGAGVAAVLEHERIPFVSWPYEWSFSMLKDAALSQLELMKRALAEQLILKDGTPYNTQFRGTKPVFIDVGSFEQLREGEPWFGYRQFCMQFLYPLMLQAFHGIPYQPLLRGRLDGIQPEEMRRSLRLRDWFRRGVLTHVVLHARLERRRGGESTSDARAELKKAGFGSKFIAANVEQLSRLIGRLDWNPGGSEWSGYSEDNTYDEGQLAAKEAFVAEAAETASPSLVWDMGCNDGRFSLIAARHADYVVAMDADQLTVDRLYRRLREEGSDKVLPLTLDLVDSSPNMGWRGAERRALDQRGRPDLVLALALVHHMTIGANVPVDDFADWLAGLGDRVVVEFPHRDDPMVERLLARKRSGAHPDYELDRFAAALERPMEIERREELGTRTLFRARRR